MNKREDLIIVDNGTIIYEEETGAYMDRQLTTETNETHERYKKAFKPLFEDRNKRFLRAKQTCSEFFEKKSAKPDVVIEDLESENRLTCMTAVSRNENLVRP